MEGYSDDQIGPLEEVGCDGHRGGDIERILLDTAVQDFITKYKHTRERLTSLLKYIIVDGFLGSITV